MSYLYFTDSKTYDGKAVGDVNGAGYNGKGLTDSSVKNVIVPSNYQGRTVVEIALYAFYQKQITSIFIPKTIIRISRCAFQECKSLTVVKFESKSKLKECGDAVFYQCTALKKIDLPPLLSSIETSFYFFHRVSLDCFSFLGTHDFSTQANFFTITPKVIHVPNSYPSTKFASKQVIKDGRSCGISSFFAQTSKRRLYSPHCLIYLFLIIQS